MNKRIQDVIQRYLKLYPPTPVGKEVLTSIEARLGIILSSDFIEICQVFNGVTPVGDGNFYAFDAEGEHWNITNETLKLRKQASFPDRYVALYEDNGMVIMETQNSPDESTPIIACGYSDIENYFEGKSLEAPHQIYPSFLAYFEKLLEQEEEDRSHSNP